MGLGAGAGREGQVGSEPWGRRAAGEGAGAGENTWLSAFSGGLAALALTAMVR
jgi:hypothetical protein